METAMKENGQKIWKMGLETSILIQSVSGTKENFWVVSETDKALMCSKMEICNRSFRIKGGVALLECCLINWETALKS